jgi:hypothetical protein
VAFTSSDSYCTRMAQSIRIIVTCSARKRGQCADSPRLSAVGGSNLRQRLNRWIRLRDCSRNLRPASEVYVGEHWSVARRLPERAAGHGLKPELFVCSAGYGLIKSDHPICPYGASFAPRTDDSVSRGSETVGETNRSWWAGLCRKGAIGGVTALAVEHERTPILVVVSGEYFRAIREDLALARQALIGERMMTIVCSGSVVAGEDLRDCIVDAPGSLQWDLGGTLGSLNVRVAELAVRYVNRSGIDRDALLADIDRRLAGVTKPRVPVRRGATDQEIESWIRSLRRPLPSRTQMLRQLRDLEGVRCEQGRFRSIYERVLVIGCAR